jgi:hypothetical protein
MSLGHPRNRVAAMRSDDIHVGIPMRARRTLVGDSVAAWVLVAPAASAQNAPADIWTVVDAIVTTYNARDYEAITKRLDSGARSSDDGGASSLL